MNTIEVLDKNTIDKIAAGEVVERPAWWHQLYKDHG